MTAAEVEKLNREHERKIRRTFLWACGLCLCAFMTPLISLLGWFRPQAEPLGQWFQRSGAVMTVFAVYAQFQVNNIVTMIAGAGFGNTFGFYWKYQRRQKVVAVLSLVPAIIGTLIWGYGDLLFPLLHGP